MFQNADNFIDELIGLMKRHQNDSAVSNPSDPSIQRQDVAVLNQYNELKEIMTKGINILTTRITLLEKEATKIHLKLIREEVVTSLKDISCLEPRGKFDVNLSTTGLFLEGKQFNIVADWSNITDMMLIPSSTTTKKEGEDLLAIRMNSPVKCNNRDVFNLIIVLSKNESKPIDAALNSQQINGSESTVMSLLINDLWKYCNGLVRPNARSFQSRLNQKYYIKCHRGIQEGALYPLESGLLFIKPMLFIPADDITFLSAGRGGSSSSTKYIDVVIELKDEKKIEFTNIEREELPYLQKYVHSILEARKLKNKTTPKIKTEHEDSMNESSGASESVEEKMEKVHDHQDRDLDSDEEDDEDYQPDSSDGESNSVRSYDTQDSDDDDQPDDGSISSQSIASSGKRNHAADEISASPKKRKFE